MVREINFNIFYYTVTEKSTSQKDKIEMRSLASHQTKAKTKSPEKKIEPSPANFKTPTKLVDASTPAKSQEKNHISTKKNTTSSSSSSSSVKSSSSSANKLSECKDKDQFKSPMKPPSEKKSIPTLSSKSPDDTKLKKMTENIKTLSSNKQNDDRKDSTYKYQNGVEHTKASEAKKADGAKSVDAKSTEVKKDSSESRKSGLSNSDKHHRKHSDSSSKPRHKDEKSRHSSSNHSDHKKHSKHDRKYPDSDDKMREKSRTDDYRKEVTDSDKFKDSKRTISNNDRPPD